MTVYDISTEIGSAPVYPGDPQTEINCIKRIGNDSDYALTELKMCLHTGTHVESPSHFVAGGNTIDETPLSVFMGECTVVSCLGMDDLTGADIDELVKPGTRRVLFKTLGKCRLTRSAAFSLISLGVQLVGIDAQSIAVENDESSVHRELMLAGITLLEGLALRHVRSGEYTLMALPLKISGVEAAPCRAVLLKN